MPSRSISRRIGKRRASDRQGSDTIAAKIARVDALTATGRTNWLALLAYLAFVFVTALGVADIDFFIESRHTQLPLVGVSIPTFSFFVFAPILGAALYVYLHLHIQKTSEALADLPLVIHGAALEKRIAPWLVNDLILRLRGGGSISPRPLDALATVVTVALVWFAGPYVLAFLWWRSWPAHSVLVTLLCAACTMLSLLAGCQSWATMERDLTVKRPFALVSSGAMNVRAFWLTAVIVVFSLIPTKGIVIPGDQFHLPKWAQGLHFVASPDLTGARLSVLPPEHDHLETAQHRYRTEWCQRNGLPPTICGGGSVESVDAINVLWRGREAWCAKVGFSDCRAHFASLDDEFDYLEWPIFRNAIIAAIDKPDLSGKDLRAARLSYADLTGISMTGINLERADLSGAQLEGADLTEAHLAGANLSEAQLVRANLSFAWLEGADLSDAWLESAILTEARLKGANLRGAWLKKAHLSWARLEGADLSEARLEEASLGGAGLERANLSGARLEGASLYEARLNEAILSWSIWTGTNEQPEFVASIDLSGALNSGGALRFIDLSRALISPTTDFRNSFGDASVLLPDGIERPCQWAQEPLSEADFYSRWRGWIEANTSSPSWNSIAPVQWREVEPVPAPAGCTWLD